MGAAAPTPPRGTYPAPPGTPASSRVPAAEDEDDLVIRPFLLTGGRTRPRRSKGSPSSRWCRPSPARPPDALRFEARRIVEICWQPTSVAELSAALRVPLGVVRVLVSDLVGGGPGQRRPA